MDIAIWIAALAFACAINAARGGRFPVINDLPGHTRLWATLAFVLLTGAVTWWRDAHWSTSLIWGACYLAWAQLPWGRWFDLNHGSLPDAVPRPPSAFERFVERIAPEDHSAFALRNAIGLIPAAVLISPFMLVLVAAQHAAYWIGWKASKTQPIAIAEYITGVAWGVAIMVLL